jgi:hypothetical protein
MKRYWTVIIIVIIIAAVFYFLPLRINPQDLGNFFTFGRDSQSTLTSESVDLQDSIGNIRMNSISSDIYIARGEKNTFSYKHDRKSTDFEYSADGGSFSLKEYGKGTLFNIGSFGSKEFRLTTMDLQKDVNVHSVSGEIFADGITCENGTFGSTSGDIELRNFAADTARFESVSGEITVDSGSMKKITVGTVSGDVRFYKVSSLQNANINTTSGEVIITGLDLSKYKIIFSSVSGSLSAGDLGKIKSRGEIGNGEYTISIRTVSGDVKITSSL